MKDACHVGEIVQDFHRVAVRLALVHHDGKAFLACKLHLQPERALLHLSRHVLIVIIQPDLAHGFDAGMTA